MLGIQRGEHWIRPPFLDCAEEPKDFAALVAFLELNFVHQTGRPKDRSAGGHPVPEENEAALCGHEQIQSSGQGFRLPAAFFQAIHPQSPNSGRI